jgi:hypothetical protein
MQGAEVPEDMGKWQKSVMDRLCRHYEPNARGIKAMMNADLFDVFDALTVAPLIASEAVASSAMPEFERRRLEQLESREYGPAECENF